MPTQSELELKFKIGHNNGTMDMQIFVNDQLKCSYIQSDNDHVTFKQLVDWPSVVKIVLTNKNNLHDTSVDNHGKVIADKYIELKEIVVDRMPANQTVINSICLNTTDSIINSCYWGFNGVVYIQLDQHDSFEWHLKNLAQGPNAARAITSDRI
jgi:uncharacterized pyridoxamine 5'-phosphate oxidase family protein